MMTIRVSPDVYKKLQVLRSKDKKLFKKVQKQLKLFKQNPRHKSLRRHKITREIKSVWSISIDKSYRMLYREDESEYYFFAVGTHDEVYRKT